MNHAKIIMIGFLALVTAPLWFPLGIMYQIGLECLDYIKRQREIDANKLDECSCANPANECSSETNCRVFRRFDNLDK